MRPILLAALLATAMPAAADTLARLGETGTIRLGYRADALPLSFADDSGLPAGLSVAICEAVADDLAAVVGRDRLEREYVLVTTEDRFEAVAEGRIDLLCGAATITLERRETVDFSIPTFVDGAAVLVRAGAEARRFADLGGARIGVRGGTTTEQALAATLEAEGMEAEIVPFDDHSAGRDALMAGEIGAYFGDQSILIGLILTSGAPAELAISDDMLTVEKQGLAMARGDTEFRLAVDRSLSGLYASGRMEEIFVAALPGVEPGLALQALFLIAPDRP
jgi:polar amino acid transport system substrate-binding protein/glutamate/aspartate transport system substrate-binding protein